MTINDNINLIKNNIFGDVLLVAVSKTQSIPVMQEAYEAGIRDFGENKVQELLDKYESFPDVRWHFIGNLQKNKVKYLVDKVYLIHSLSSVGLLKEIEKQYSKRGSKAKVLIEVNIGREDTKGGVFLEDIPNFIEEVEACEYVKVLGLMAIIPPGDEVSCTYYFKEMKKLWDSLKGNNYKNITMKYLSMGMSGDYKIALSQGSNIIRIGQGIFGKRNR
ncbi:YggS family pyridoxal phosphate-dependent enzyme [Alloiococcus sp. CFN-8]|uniref:YggS family pyridoxal phosphate-dependent enzyme n=1 Tax=Alloiococcus sp. CFN-8 TaxID=3416081 RepID=UPI003CE782F6